MPKFAANLTFLFNELPFMDRFKAAAYAGFRAVEYMSPYAYSAVDLKRMLDANNLQQALFNLPAGDWDNDERGLACLPEREAEFREGVATAIGYAQVLGCKKINCLAGKLPPGVPHEVAQSTMIANLKYAAAQLKQAGIMLVTEPINSFDMPGYFVNKTHDALAILDAVGSDNAFIQYDIYHAQRMEGELGNTLSALLPRIGHIQIADNPGRHEPGTGEINYPWIFSLLDSMGYDGWVGCEYKPKTTTVAGLGWMRGVIPNAATTPLASD
jgi:hydroxypyruvate isomerase